MKTINDIIGIMNDTHISIACPDTICQYCNRYNFCWQDTYKIAMEYIKREGVI